MNHEITRNSSRKLSVFVGATVPAQLPGFGGPLSIIQDLNSITDTYVFSPNVINQARAHSRRILRRLYLDDTVTARVTVTEIRTDKPSVTLATVCTNQRDEQLLTGEAVVLVSAGS